MISNQNVKVFVIIFQYMSTRSLWWPICAMSYKRVFWAKMVILAGFRMATFRLARQRCDTQKPKTQRMECRVLSCGGAKGRHAKTRKSHHLAGFRVAPFRLFRPENMIIRNGTNGPP